MQTTNPLGNYTVSVISPLDQTAGRLPNYFPEGREAITPIKNRESIMVCRGLAIMSPSIDTSPPIACATIKPIRPTSTIDRPIINMFLYAIDRLY